ncbi:MAG: SUMF1/EgtB/PvdO family nonheme iron enzyme [Alloprevotella sp.]|nr:SUMF1/EgtB/PvdO family nonheme iron enzyme [Alloprevotella sp.]
MRKYILFFLLLAFTLNATAQTQITRKSKKEQSAAKPKPKPANKPAAKPKPKPTPAPHPAAPVEAAGYDVTFSCNAPGARIVVDGTSTVADAGSLFLRTGSHTVRVTAEGYEDYSSSFSVNSSHRTCSISMTKKRNQNKTFTANGVSFNMVYVAGGTFQMGSNDGESDERPVHSVTLSDYYIGQTEVTQELWQAVMGSNPSFSRTKGAKNPVNNVSWNDCQEFISKLNRLTGGCFRLPTEAEWEYAARGGNKSRGYKYSGSDDLGSVAWNEDNSGKEVHPVGSKSANELGLYDMSGNVWEWCSDRYGDYPSSPQTNPTGPSSGSDRVGRGGSWVNSAAYCRVAYRNYGTPTGSGDALGLRLAH